MTNRRNFLAMLPMLAATAGITRDAVYAYGARTAGDDRYEEMGLVAQFRRQLRRWRSKGDLLYAQMGARQAGSKCLRLSGDAVISSDGYQWELKLRQSVVWIPADLYTELAADGFQMKRREESRKAVTDQPESILGLPLECEGMPIVVYLLPEGWEDV